MNILIIVRCSFFLLLVLGSNNYLFSQISFGASYGLQIPGRQDLKFKYYENDELIHEIKTTYVRIDVTSISNFNVTFWKGQYGVRLDYYSWEHYSTAKEFELLDRPPFFTVEQSREAILVSGYATF